MKTVIQLLALFFIGITIPTTSYAGRLHASHIQANEGMHQSTIYSIYQDEFGMMWFGTKNGLVCYDGIKAQPISKVYKDVPQAEELIRSITGNRNGKIYLETRSGIIEYDIRSNRFRQITDSSNGMYYGKTGLWVCIKNTIYQWKDNVLITYYSLPQTTATIDCIIEAEREDIYVGTREHGVFLIEKDKSVKNILPTARQVKQLFLDSEQKIWVATRRDGLYKLNRRNDTICYRNNPQDEHSISSNIIRSVCDDNAGNLWVATFNGLNKYSRQKDKFQRYDFINENAYTLNDASIYCLMKDQQGTIWSGSFYGEINCFNPEYETFSYHFATKDSDNKVSNHAIFGKTVEDSDGNLWISSERGGLYQFNPHNKELKHIPLSRNYNVQTLYLDQASNTLWIGTLLNGLIKYNFKNKSFSAPIKVSIQTNSIREIIPYDGQLILATHNGVSLFNPQTNTSTHLDTDSFNLNSISITSMLLDRRNRLWIAAHNKLLSYDLRHKKWTSASFNSPSKEHYFITKIMESSVGDIWIGTSRQGLFQRKKGETGFKPVNTGNAPTQSSVIDITEDSHGGILAVTSEGLTYIKSEKEVVNISKNKFLSTFKLADNCLFLDKQNNVYLGGINMLCEFPLKKLFDRPQQYTVNISGLTINDESVEVNPESDLLRESLFYSDDITLPSSAHSISVSAFTNNYTSAFNCGIRYKLEPFDKEWKHANSLNEITYTNLSPDKYTLRIQGDVQLANGSYPERVFHITIRPPFYATPLAYIIYILLAIILLYEAYQVIVLRSSLKFEKEQKRQMEILNQSKLRFFTNISHEFKTPLTLISNQTELILQSKALPPKLYNRVIGIWKNTMRMNKLIAELMEFRKQEQGFTPLKVNFYNLTDLVNDIALTFKDYAHSRKISLNVILEEEDISFYFDRQQMEKALFNLLSNAFKFTPEQGSITLKAFREYNKASVEVIDTGIGIHAKDLNEIFVRFYQTDNTSFTNNIGTGIGLAYAKSIVNAHQGDITVKSIKGKGSCFTIKLPTDIHYRPEEIQENLSVIKEYDLLTSKEEKELVDEAFIHVLIDEQESADSLHAKILIIEDNDELRELLATVFSPLYTVETASNGKEGYEKTHTFKPEIIVSDVVMPEMSGTELCRKLKSNFETSHIPIILLTSQATSEYVIEGLKTGADDYISKPFSIKQLIVRCNNLVNSRKALQKVFAKEPNTSAELIAISSLDQSLLEESITIIESNLENPMFSVDFIAKEMKIGRTQYFAKIKAITGMTPNEFIVNTKLKLAYKLIKEKPAIPTYELALQLGFSSPSYFIKRFKEYSGMTPKQYKQSVLNKEE